MSHQSDLIATDIEAYLAEHEDKDLLRLLTCGSVDDGKSTLIGRLLHDSHMIYEDQLDAVKADSTTQGSTGGDLDLSLLMDGLKAEREQGITIDVAYRYFSTKRRKFIIADTPGHEQYTRNMVTGASTAQLAVLMLDARKGVLPQTKRHSTIAHLLGIRHVVVAINKMDLVDWSQETYDQICKEYETFAEELGATFAAYFLPMSALTGANVVNPAGDEMPWFDGPPLMEHLETVDVTSGRDYDHLRLPVQLVSRPNLDFRGFQGTIASGVLRPGDQVTVLPSGVSSTVGRIVTFDGDLEVAGPGDAVTITLTDEIDVSRGDVLVHDPNSMQRGHKVDAMLVWMAETPMRTGQSYLLQSTAGRSNATVPNIRYQLDMDTLGREEPDRLELNSIARVGIEVDRELLFDPYDENRTTGSFILVDRLTNATVGAGMVIGKSSTWDQEAIETLQRAVSLVTPEERATRYAQQPATVLLTGLTGAGKSTIAKALERRLFDSGRIAVRLDGQNVRQGVSRDLGFTAPERSENVRRVAEVGRLLNDQGIIAIAAMLAPIADDRERAKEVVGAHRFIEVHVDTPVEVCRERDPGGLYSALANGAVIDLPGITSDYEAPPNPDLVTTDWDRTADAAAEEIVDLMRERGMLRGGRPAPADDPAGGEVDTSRDGRDGSREGDTARDDS